MAQRLSLQPPSGPAGPADAPQADHHDLAAMLDPLPIAAALMQPDRKGVRLISVNRQFIAKGLDEGGRAELDYRLIGDLVQRARRDTAGRAAIVWQSPKTVGNRRLEISAAILEIGSGDPLAMVTFVDRTAEMDGAATLRREMLRDSLTGLPNRTGFEEQVEERLDSLEVANQSGLRSIQFAMLTVDIARFSQINECAGSVVGDELIITVARRLMTKLRKIDVVGRIGGNEFAIFVELRKGARDIDQLAERIQSVFATPYRLSDLEIQVEAAIGVAIGAVGNCSAAECLRHAQIALKRAKQTKIVEVYTPEALDNARRRFTLETELRKALEKDRLELFFQPLIDMNSGLIMGFEALTRWNDPDRGPIRPNEFIAVAEESGLIVPLGRWALEQACRTLKQWDKRAEGVLPIKISVNVSAVQFARDDIPRMVAQVLRDTRVPGRRITLELTESVIVSDPDRARKVMQALRDLHATLALDDFGTGYSNLAYLQMLPIDILKIDRSFVQRMLEDKDKVAIVRAILSLASALGMETTAEGIESLELFKTLAALGCSFGQGHYFAAPLPPERALAMYQAQGVVPLTDRI